MKMSPHYSKAQANMQPGVITADGFLGDDHRSLADIIEADEEQFSRLDLSFQVVSEKLRHLIEEGRKGLGEPVTVDGKWIVTISEARGRLASPFEDGVFRKINATVVTARDGQPQGTPLLVSDLSLHLLEKHHFLEGKGAPFRLEPADLKRVLDL